MNRPRALLTLMAILAALAFSACGSDSSTDSSDTVSTESTDSTDATDTEATDTEATDTVATDTVATDSTDVTDSSAERDALIQGVQSSLAGSGLPAGYTDCVVQKAGELTDDEIKTLEAEFTSGNTQAAQNLGVDLGKQCISEGAGIDEFRTAFVSSIKTGLAGSGLSAAYTNCVINKANSDISDQELSALLLQYTEDPASAQTKGVALGKQLGQTCVDSGVQP